MRPTTTLTTILAISMLVALPAVSSTADCLAPDSPETSWPMFGHDLRNTRHQTGPAPSPDEARSLLPSWTYSVADHGASGDITGTPIVSGGCVFAGTNEGWVVALDAQTGKAIWATQSSQGGGINSSVAVNDGTVFAHVSIEGAPRLVAFDASSGTELWTTITDDQPGSDAFSSPVVYEGAVFVGISGDAAQHSGEDSERGFAGSFVLIDASSGEVITKTYTITPDETRLGFGGATVSIPPAIDDAGFAYVGTSSAYIPQNEHDFNNSVLKIDLRAEDPASPGQPNPSYGEIITSYKGDTFDAVIPGYSDLDCTDLPIPAPPAIVPTGRGVGACGDVDVDFATAPNLLPDGTLMSMQKSGAMHAIMSHDMTPLWRNTVAPAQPFGGASAAFDGTNVIGAAAPPGQLFAINPDGGIRWIAPLGDVAHYGLPVASANGVAYSLDVRGVLNAVDSESGLLLAARPLAAGRTDIPVAFGGVSIANNTVYAAVGFQSTGADAFGVGNGLIVAFRPAL